MPGVDCLKVGGIWVDIYHLATASMTVGAIRCDPNASVPKISFATTVHKWIK